MKKMGYFFRIILLILIAFGLLFYGVPSKSLAQTSSCSLSSEAGIRLQDGGFLSLAKSDDANRFYTSEKYICGVGASIPQFSLPSYAEMKSLYFDQSKSANKTTLTGNQDEGNIPLTGTNNRLYYITGNLTLNNKPSGNNTGIIFIDGNLLIKTPNKKFDFGDNYSGIVFVVQGNVYIDQGMGGGASKSLDAFFITFGQFCSASTGDSATTATCQPSGTTAPQLIINGSIISLGTSTPQFVRSLTNNTNPAEIINFQPKYLVILKDIFARDLKIWKEIQ